MFQSRRHFNWSRCHTFCHTFLNALEIRKKVLNVHVGGLASTSSCISVKQTMNAGLVPPKICENLPALVDIFCLCLLTLNVCMYCRGPV